MIKSTIGAMLAASLILTGCQDSERASRNNAPSSRPADVVAWLRLSAVRRVPGSGRAPSARPT